MSLFRAVSGKHAKSCCAALGVMPCSTSSSINSSNYRQPLQQQSRMETQQQQQQQQPQQQQQLLQRQQRALFHLAGPLHRAMSTTTSSSSSKRSSSIKAVAGGSLLLEKTGGEGWAAPVYTVTLNRPAALNALTSQMLEFLCSFFTEKIEEKDALVILKGAGDRAFCAGGDVRAVSMGGSSLAIAVFSLEHILFRMLSLEKGPTVISVWNGLVMGGGVGLSVHGGLRICTENTVFSMPEVLIGLFPDCGMCHLFATLRLKGLGLYLGLTAARLTAADLISTELATHYVPSEKLDGVMERLKQEPTVGVKAKAWALQVLSQAQEQPPEADRLLTPQRLEWIEKYFSEAKSIQELMASLEKGAESCNFCSEAVEQLRLACPLSLAVTFKAIRDREKSISTTAAAEVSAEGDEGAFHRGHTEAEVQQQLRHDQKQLLEALEIDKHLIINMTTADNYNFKEGIRALLVDKDKNPKWQPPSVGEVSPSAVEKLFEHCPLGGPSKL